MVKIVCSGVRGVSIGRQRPKGSDDVYPLQQP